MVLRKSLPYETYEHDCRMTLRNRFYLTKNNWHVFHVFKESIEAKMVKQIAKTGCNVLLVQKSILRDAVTDLSLDFCAKACLFSAVRICFQSLVDRTPRHTADTSIKIA